MFETVVDGIIIADSSGVIVAVNPAVHRIFGYSAEELIGQNVRMLMPPPDFDLHDGYLENYRSTGVRKIIGMGREVTGRRNDGTLFPIYLGVNETVTERGKFFVGIVHDIAERVAATEMRIAKEAAERANVAKSEFLSRMSHELRTPLNAVIGFAQLLNMRYEDSRVREATDSILRAGQHLLSLINEVLDLSRIESGQLTVSIEPVPLEPVIAQAIELLKPQAQRRNVTVTFDREQCRQLMVIADRQRLLQVCINLVSNALKYNRDQGQVEVYCEPLPADKCRILFRDTGIGIRPEDQPRLFQPFERFSEGVAEGTGLGLLLSRRFLSLMEGQLELSSSSPAGSIFAVTLQLAKGGFPTQAPNNESAHRESHPSRARILCIEDNLPNLKLIQMALEDWPKVELMSATTATLGLELATAHSPDLVLLDLHLPDIDGTEVLRRLKSMEMTAGIPVVVITADATPGVSERLRALGAYAYLTKPLDMRLFNDLLEKLLSKRGAHA